MSDYGISQELKIKPLSSSSCLRKLYRSSRIQLPLNMFTSKQTTTHIKHVHIPAYTHTHTHTHTYKSKQKSYFHIM